MQSFLFSFREVLHPAIEGLSILDRHGEVRVLNIFPTVRVLLGIFNERLASW